jgi:release factor glutamine methyltransferase
MRRVGVLLAMLLVVGCGLAWTLGAKARAGRGENPGPAVRSRRHPPDEVPSSPRPHADHRPEALVVAPTGVGAPGGTLQAPGRINRWERVEGLPRPIAVFDTVFWEPEDTRRLRAVISNTGAVRGKTVLEIGTGTGLLSLCCLRAGAAKVVATDINPAAVSNAIYNARLLGLADRLEVRLVPPHRPEAYSVVGESEKFDLIISNPPWENARPESIDKYAYFDPDFQLLRSLLAGVEDHLSPGGVGVVSYGSVDAIRTLQRLAPQFGLETRAWDRRSLQGVPGVFLPGMLIEIVPQPTSPAGPLPSTSPNSSPATPTRNASEGSAYASPRLRFGLVSTLHHQFLGVL